MIQDLIKASQRLEVMLSTTEKFSSLDPRFLLVGSIAEGTKIKPAVELDLPVQFKGIMNRPLLLGEDAFTLKLPQFDDFHPLSTYSYTYQSNSWLPLSRILNYGAFFEEFLTQISNWFGGNETLVTGKHSINARQMHIEM